MDMKQQAAYYLNKPLMQLYEYWLSHSGNGEIVPFKSSFDPIEIPKLLSSLIVLELRYEEEEAPKIYCRLVGSDIAGHWGKDYTGTYLDDVIDGALLTYFSDHYQGIASRKRPQYRHFILRWQDGKISNNSRLYLPYASEDHPDRISYVIVGHIIRNDNKTLVEPIISQLKQLQVIELDYQEF